MVIQDFDRVGLDDALISNAQHAIISIDMTITAVATSDIVEKTVYKYM